jgi:uncharacterized protein (DUF1499 family)
MSSETPRRDNGRQKLITCPNSPECAVAQAAADALSMIDTRLATLGSQLHQVALHLSEVSERQTRGDQREAEWLAQMIQMTRAVSALREG